MRKRKTISITNWPVYLAAVFLPAAFLPAAARAHLLDEGQSVQNVELQLGSGGLHTTYTLWFDSVATRNFINNTDSDDDGEISQEELASFVRSRQDEQPVFLVVRAGALTEYYQEYKPLKPEEITRYDQNDDGQLDPDETFAMVRQSPIQQYYAFQKNVPIGAEFEILPKNYTFHADLLRDANGLQYVRFTVTADYPIERDDLFDLAIELQFKHFLSASHFSLEAGVIPQLRDHTLPQELHLPPELDRMFAAFEHLPKVRRVFMRLSLPPAEPQPEPEPAAP